MIPPAQFELSNKSTDIPQTASQTTYISPQPQSNSINNHNIINNLSNYFQDILTGKRKFSVFLIGILLGIITSIGPSYALIRYGIPFISDLDQKVSVAIDEVLPEELEIKIQSGIASTNITEPYYLTISQSVLIEILQFKKTADSKKPQSKIRLLVIDTGGNVEDFERHQSLSMLTSKSLVYYSDDDIKIQPLSSIPDTTINKKIIKEKINEFNKNGRVINFIKIIFFVAPIFIATGFLIYFLIEILTGTFLVWLINKILKTNISFGKLFGLTSALYSIPAFLLIIVKSFPYISLFYGWIYTALDVMVLAFAYFIISIYKENLSKNQ